MRKYHKVAESGDYREATPMHFDERAPATLKVAARFCSIMLTCAAVFVTQPSRAVEPQHERLVYNIMVGGLHIGDAMIGLRQSPDGYSTEMKMTAKGVAKWVRNFRSDMRGEGRFADGANTLKPLPANYSRQWSNGEVAGDMTMTFHPNTGEAVVEERYFNPATREPIAVDDLPWNKDDPKGSNDRKPLPAGMSVGVLDPVGAFIAARGQMMAQGVDGTRAKSFRIPIYDGKRRYDIIGRVETARDVAIGDAQRSVVPVIAKLEPVYGFGRRSQERMKESEGKFLFSNDARFIPLQLVVSNEMLSGVMNLTADCSRDAAPCDTFGQEKDQ